MRLIDFTPLAKSLRNACREIEFWPELELPQNLRKSVEVVLGKSARVEEFTTTLRTGESIVIFPNQYYLICVYLAPLAAIMRNYEELLQELMGEAQGRDIDWAKGLLNYEDSADSDSTKIRNLIEEQRFKQQGVELLIKLLTDSEFRFKSKSIANHNDGQFKMRGREDFFSSFYLKIINLPDASSGVLGDLVYKFSHSQSIFDELARDCAHELPFLLKDKEIKNFVYNVFAVLRSRGIEQRLLDLLDPNEHPEFLSISLGEHRLTSIFRASMEDIPATGLVSGQKPRWFDKPMFELDGRLLYLSTEWTWNRESRLDLESFRDVFNTMYAGEYEITVSNSEFFMRSTGRQPIAKSDRGDFRDDQSWLQAFNDALEGANYRLATRGHFPERMIAALASKRFLIFTGLSGSGKTLLARAFARWISDSEDQVSLIAVGADWTNRDPLLGYHNGLDRNYYVRREALDLLLKAKASEESVAPKPYFLILDEMNLSHVERYFADFLSSMESNEEISLHSEEENLSGVPRTIRLPSNLFIIGTVNVDETTYMFSPKVLDRASVIEFRLDEEDLIEYLSDPRPIDFASLVGGGSKFACSFLEMSAADDAKISDDVVVKQVLSDFFRQLKAVGAEFGFRSAGEMMRYCRIAANFSDEVDVDGLVDAAILQKLLPKLHGSRSKLEAPLKEMAKLCLREGVNTDVALFLNGDLDAIGHDDVRFPLTLEKLCRMNRALVSHGFTSFAEA